MVTKNSTTIMKEACILGEVMTHNLDLGLKLLSEFVRNHTNNYLDLPDSTDMKYYAIKLVDNPEEKQAILQALVQGSCVLRYSHKPKTIGMIGYLIQKITLTVNDAWKWIVLMDDEGRIFIYENSRMFCVALSFANLLKNGIDMQCSLRFCDYTDEPEENSLDVQTLEYHEFIDELTKTFDDLPDSDPIDFVII